MFVLRAEVNWNSTTAHEDSYVIEINTNEAVEAPMTDRKLQDINLLEIGAWCEG